MKIFHGRESDLKIATPSPPQKKKKDSTSPNPHEFKIAKSGFFTT